MGAEEANVAVEIRAEPKAKKPKVASKKSGAATSHPPYAQMITDAITTLKERNGLSQHAIAKFIEEKHKNLPSSFRKLLLGNLRKSVASGKVTKVKGSFKLPAAAPKKSTLKPTKPKAAAKQTNAKPKTAVAAKAVATKAKPKAKTEAVKAKPKVRTSTRSTPVKKADVGAKAVVKKVKKVTPRKVKSPVKKAAVGAKKAKK